MNYAYLVEVFDSVYELSEKLGSLGLFESLFLEDELKKFALWDVLHDQKKLFGGFDDFVKLNDIRVSHLLQNVDFSGDSFNISDVIDFTFF